MVRAVMAWNEAEALTDDDPLVRRRRSELLEEVVESLEAIVTQYSGSDLAVRLITGEKIGTLSMEDARWKHREAVESREVTCGFFFNASCIFAMALDSADEVPTGKESIVLPRIAISLAEAGRFEEADRILEQVDTERLQSWDQIPLAKARKDAAGILDAVSSDEGEESGYDAVIAATALAEIGEYEKGLSLAQSLRPEPMKNQATVEVVHAMAKRGDLQKAILTVDGLSPGRGRDLARERLVMVQQEAGQIEDAMRIAEGIDDDAWRDVARIRLLNPRDDKEAFNAAMEQIEAALAADRADEDDLRSSLLAAKIKAYALALDFERAVELVRSLPREMNRNVSLRYVATQQAKAASVEDALQTVSFIEDKYQAALALSSIAVVLIQRSSLSEALEILGRIKDDDHRNRALCWLGVELAEDGMVTTALEHLSEIDAGETCRAMSIAEVAVIQSRSE